MKLLALVLALPVVSSVAVSILANLRERQAAVMALMADGKQIPVTVRNTNFSAPESGFESGLQQTPIGFSVIAGLALVSTGNLGYQALVNIDTHLGELFFKPGHDAIWHNQEFCRTYSQTRGGGNCEIRTYEKGSGDRTAMHHPENEPSAPEGIPDVNAFDDPGVGLYSVFMTATDQHHMNVVETPSTCAIEGICNPQYIIYRDGFEIVLDTWNQQGTLSRCQYSGGEDCGGLCSSGVKDQFSSGGVTWGGDCAIPCIGDDVLPSRV
ncbi:hypothetical protein ACHAQA_008694 [Verticillium albo-atrum]